MIHGSECLSQSDNGLYCTEMHGHDGHHKARGSDGRVLKRWLAWDYSDKAFQAMLRKFREANDGLKVE